MSRRRLGWFMAMAMLALLVAVSAPAFPQEAAEPEIAKEAEPTTGESTTVDRILRQQEEQLRGQHFSYEPAGRRDPFRDLFLPEAGSRTERPPGVAGMLVTEIDLAGIVKDDAGDVAMVIGSDNKGYFLRVGDQVFDGTVIAVDPRKGAVTFRQEVDDPRLIKPYRDVTKKLVPLDEGSADE